MVLQVWLCWVTHISAAAGSLTWMVIEWIKFGKPSVLGIVTGMVAGLGTITPASGFVGPAGALAIGITAGIVCFYAVQIVQRHFKIDDSRCLSCAWCRRYHWVYFNGCFCS